MKSLIFTASICAMLSFLVTPVMAEPGEKTSDGPELTIGSDAPALDVEHWVSKGKGKFEEVTSFEDGNVYVVEFWATWCGPCVASMPHISQLQKEYADKGVQVISISDEPLETVKTFLERSVQGQEGDQTYAELTSNYCLTTDPDGSVSQDYMVAAGQTGIPAAFVVGKTGKIEWIGHPMVMEEPLEEIVAGTWDREAFGEKFRTEQMLQAKTQEVMQLFQAGEIDKAVSTLDEVLTAIPEGAQKERLKTMRIQLLVLGGGDKAVSALQEFANNNPQPEDLGRMVNLVAMLSQQGRADEKVVGAATKLAKKCIKAQPDNPGHHHALSNLHYAQGDIKKALASNSKAIELAQDSPQAVEQLKQFRTQLENEAEAATEEPGEK